MPRRAGAHRLRLAQLLLALAGAVLLVLLVRAIGLESIVARLSRLDPGWLAAYAGIEVAIFSGYALRWRFLLRALDESPRFTSLLGARLAGLTVGSLTPAAKLGGEPLRAYMIAVDGVRSGPAIASVVVDRGLELVANVVFAIAYCALFALRDRTAAGQVLVVVAASGAALVAGVLVVLRRLRRGVSLVPARFVPAIERMGGSRAAVAGAEEAMRTLVFARHRTVLWSLGASLVLNGLVFAEYATLFLAFEAHPSVPELAGTLLGVGLAHAIPVPAALGTLEGAQAAMVHVSGGDRGLAVVAAAVARLRDTVWTLPGGVALVLWTWRRRRAGRSRREAT